MVPRGTDGAAWHIMVRRGTVGSASACWKAGPSSILGSAPQGGSPTEQTSDEEMERGLSKWRRINVLYECDGMNVCMYVIKYEK
jgi:hypothetical protein